MGASVVAICRGCLFVCLFVLARKQTEISFRFALFVFLPPVIAAGVGCRESFECSPQSYTDQNRKFVTTGTAPNRMGKKHNKQAIQKNEKKKRKVKHDAPGQPTSQVPRSFMHASYAEVGTIRVKKARTT
jgi:hypothetical protein